MDLEQRLIGIIERARSPSDALDAVAEAVAHDELSDACAVFLAGTERRLTLWARSGEFAQTRGAAESLVHASLERVAATAAEHAGRVLLAAPLLSTARPIGAIVVERDEGQPYTTSEVRRLIAIAAHIVGVVEGARLIDMIAHAAESHAREGTAAAPVARDERVLEGIAASPGVAIGSCAFRQTFPHSPVRLDVARQDPEAERGRLRDAIEETRNDLKRLQVAVATELGEEQALIFAAHLMLLADPMLLDRVERAIGLGQSAAVAVDRARSEIVGQLRLVEDAYIRERVEDLEDLCSRILTYLIGASGTQTPGAQIVVSRQITPSLVVELHGQGTLGVASEIGGSTSHSVLLARALGFPAVTGVNGLLSHAVAGRTLVVDGDRGVVVLDPSAQTLIEYRARSETAERTRTEFEVYRDRAPVTADGFRFTLRANVAFAADIEIARANNADGIGLYRTEFPFAVHDGIPTIEEQARIYARACRAFPDQPVVFRILDLAADKLLPGSGLAPSGNAFQGYRSIRLLFDRPHILRDQVRAFAMAAGQHPYSVLIPMVTSVDELRRVKRLIASALDEDPDTSALPRPRIGVLIEVPAAVEIAAELAFESDFLSVGTNDLMQYALVIDRDDPRLSSPLDAFHPAVLRMVRRVVLAAHAAGKEVTVCGEIAARYELALALLALGVDALSVTPRAIPEVKQRLAHCVLSGLRRDMDHVLELATATEVERAIRKHLGVNR